MFAEQNIDIFGYSLDGITETLQFSLGIQKYIGYHLSVGTAGVTFSHLSGIYCIFFHDGEIKTPTGTYKLTLNSNICNASIYTILEKRTDEANIEEIDVALAEIAEKIIDAERIELERIESERIESERIESERIESERVELERIEVERVELERIEVDIEAIRIEAQLASEHIERRIGARIFAEEIGVELIEESEQIDGIIFQNVRFDRVIDVDEKLIQIENSGMQPIVPEFSIDNFNRILCPLCIDNLKNVTLNCGHLFCNICIRKHYNATIDETNNLCFDCPICRKNITNIISSYVL